MPAFTKEQMHLYVSDTGTKYYGVPRQAHFNLTVPLVRAAVNAKYPLDSSNEPWEAFTPKEAFIGSGGGREVLAFDSIDPMSHTIYGEAEADKDFSIGCIGPDGDHVVDQPVHIQIRAVDPAYAREKPHGYVIRYDNRFFASIYLPRERVEELARELIARPSAVLHANLNFAYYQSEIDDREFAGPILIENKVQIPIIEASIVVASLPPLLPEPVMNDRPEPAPQPVVVPATDFSPVVTRLNWAIGLLVVLILVAMFN